MATAPKSGKSVKPITKIAKLFDFGTSTAIGITRDKLAVFYTLERIASVLGGVAFQLTKAYDGSGKTPDVYHFLLNGASTSYTCAGHSYRGKCKHVDALEALIKAGKIDAPAAKPQEAPVQQQEECWEPRCHRIPANGGPYCELHSDI